MSLTPTGTPLFTRVGRLLLAVIIAVAAYNAGLRSSNNSAQENSSLDLARFNEVLTLIQEQHVGPKPMRISSTAQSRVSLTRLMIRILNTSPLKRWPR